MVTVKWSEKKRHFKTTRKCECLSKQGKSPLLRLLVLIVCKKRCTLKVKGNKAPNKVIKKLVNASLSLHRLLPQTRFTGDLHADKHSSTEEPFGSQQFNDEIRQKVGGMKEEEKERIFTCRAWCALLTVLRTGKVCWSE